MNEEQIASELKCVYCDANPVSSSEHVFPKSLGGADIYIDCVCDECNNKFSTLERELFQKSIIALLRSTEGVEGYSKSKTRPAPLKYPEIFHFDKENKIVYEVGVYKGFIPYIRPQFMSKDDRIYIEAATEEEMNDFMKIFNEWRKSNLLMVTKFPSDKREPYEAVKFSIIDNKFTAQKIELSRVKNEIIHYHLMESDDDIREYFKPRLFLDDSRKLIVRSKSIEEGVNFIINLLKYCNKEETIFKSFPKKDNTNEIKVSAQFNIDKMQRALVKIGLNCLMHFYPETKYNYLLTPSKEYVLNGKAIRTAINKKNNLLDTRPDIHTVLFYQLNEGLEIRMSLFGGAFVYSFLIEKLQLFEKENQFSGVEVNFKIKKQHHFYMSEFILNRANDLRKASPDSPQN